MFDLKKEAAKTRLHFLTTNERRVPLIPLQVEVNVAGTFIRYSALEVDRDPDKESALLTVL